MKNNLPQKFILKVKPKEYLKQGISHCGMYSVKGILSAYNKDDKKDLRDYSLSWVAKHIGFTLPWAFPKIFSKYDLQAQIISFRNTSTFEKIRKLKKLLVKNNSPVILLIGNGYQSDGTYHSLNAKITSHWVTLWGYSDVENVFYVYDSAIPKYLYDKNIPIGNKKRTYDEVVRDWGSLIFPKVLWDYLCITVFPKKN